MKNKMQLYVMSHLSDAQELIGFGIGTEASTRINFAKFLMLKCEGDLNKEYDTSEIDEFWTEYNEKF